MNRSRVLKNRAFEAAMLFAMLVAFGTLAVLLVDTLITGWPQLDAQLFSDPPSTQPDEAGARPAILATLYLGLIVLALSVPVGVLTAIYLEEYADRKRWWNRLIEVNIQNLAAVPSIVYGILGLAFIVRGPLGLEPVDGLGSTLVFVRARAAICAPVIRTPAGSGSRAGSRAR